MAYSFRPSHSAGFLPKVWPCFVGAGAFGVLAIVQWTRELVSDFLCPASANYIESIDYFRMAKGKYLLNTTIGLTTMSIGFILRYLYIQQPDSIMRYSVQNLVRRRALVCSSNSHSTNR